jgi:hypothetical protein
MWMVERSEHAFAVLDLFIGDWRQLFARRVRHREPAYPFLAKLNAEIPLLCSRSLLSIGKRFLRDPASLDRVSSALNCCATAMNQRGHGNR